MRIIICLNFLKSSYLYVTTKLTRRNHVSGDVLLHCGDFTDLGKQKQVEDFNEWIGSFKDFKHKIIIGGNHELSFDPKIVAEVRRRALDRTFCWLVAF